MAIYEFRCTKCNKINQKSLPISSKIKTVKCIYCDEDSERIISVSTFKIKGYSEKNGYSNKEKNNVKDV